MIEKTNKNDGALAASKIGDLTSCRNGQPVSGFLKSKSDMLQEYLLVVSNGFLQIHSTK